MEHRQCTQALAQLAAEQDFLGPPHGAEPVLVHAYQWVEGTVSDGLLVWRVWAARLSPWLLSPGICLQSLSAALLCSGC